MLFDHNELPEWLREATPTHVVDYVLSYDDTTEKFLLNDPNNSSFSSPQEAYDYTKDNGIHFTFDDTVMHWYQLQNDYSYLDEDDDDNENDEERKRSLLDILYDNFFTKYDDIESTRSISWKNDKGTYSAFFENSFAKKVSGLVYDIKMFEEVTAQAYYDHPDNFIYAYKFIGDHPMFWTLPYFKDRSTHVKDTFLYWITDAGIEGLSVNFYTEDDHDDNSKIICRIECGEHVAPKYNMHYFSPLLTVYGDNYEEAIIRCAAKISQYYYDDGTPKPGYEEKAQEATNRFLRGFD